MQIKYKEEQIKRKIFSLVSKNRLSAYEEKILDFLELVQSAADIQDVLSFSYINICALGNGKYGIMYADDNNFIFESDGTAVTVLSI